MTLSNYFHYFLDVLLLATLIIDRVYRMKSTKDFREAKQAQIEVLNQQLELERKNNDIEITEMHKRRNENLKLILSDKEEELGKTQNALRAMRSELEGAHSEADIKASLSERLLTELNRIERKVHDIEVEKRALLQQNTEIKQGQSPTPGMYQSTL